MTLHRGKLRPKTSSIESVYELNREDLELLKEKRPANVIKRLRDPHHNLARLIASGLKIHEAAERAGYSAQGATNLRKDPAFVELVAYYRNLVTQTFIDSIDDYAKLATSNMLKAERQIAEKLEEADEEGTLLPTRDLIAISRDAADRFGYGKRQTNLNVNVDFAAQLEKAIKRSGKVIDLPGSRLEAGAHLTTTAPPLLASQVGAPEPFRRRA